MVVCCFMLIRFRLEFVQYGDSFCDLVKYVKLDWYVERLLQYCVYFWYVMIWFMVSGLVLGQLLRFCSFVMVCWFWFVIVFCIVNLKFFVLFLGLEMIWLILMYVYSRLGFCLVRVRLRIVFQLWLRMLIFCMLSLFWIQVISFMRLLMYWLMCRFIFLVMFLVDLLLVCWLQLIMVKQFLIVCCQIYDDGSDGSVGLLWYMMRIGFVVFWLWIDMNCLMFLSLMKVVWLIVLGLGM